MNVTLNFYVLCFLSSRSVEERDKAMAMGITNFLATLLGMCNNYLSDNILYLLENVKVLKLFLSSIKKIKFFKIRPD